MNFPKHVSVIIFLVTSLPALGLVIERHEQEMNSLHRWLFFVTPPYPRVTYLEGRNFLVDNSDSF